MASSSCFLNSWVSDVVVPMAMSYLHMVVSGVTDFSNECLSECVVNCIVEEEAGDSVWDVCAIPSDKHGPVPSGRRGRIAGASSFGRRLVHLLGGDGGPA